MNIVLPSIAQRLKPLRKGLHLTQEDMGKLLNCTVRHYQKIEYGQINIPSTSIIFLANYFTVSADYLLGLREEP